MLVAAAGFAAEPSGAILRASPGTYRDAVRSLAPGQTLELEPGIYRDGLVIHRLRGELGRPITIAGPGSSQRAVFYARKGANTISIVDSAHIVLRNLELDGRGIDVDAVKAEGYSRFAHHIVLEGLDIHGFASEQQTVGISTKCPAWDWVIRRNSIVGPGTGIYLGSPDGSAPFVGGLIEENRVLDTTGYNLQIKHQGPRPELEGMPKGPAQTVIRHNVFSKAHGASAGSMARPNVLVGHWPLTGPGSDDLYVIYGNLFYRNPGEALFQGEGNLVLYANVFVNPDGDAVNIRPHNDEPRYVRVFHNTVLAAGAGIVLRAGAGRHVQRVAGNAVFAAQPLVGGEQLHNISGPPALAQVVFEAPYSRPGSMNLSPRWGALEGDVFGIGPVPDLPDWDLDFDGRKRMPWIRGAYGRNDLAGAPLDLVPKGRGAVAAAGPAARRRAGRQ